MTHVCHCAGTHVSDATLVARLGNEELLGGQTAERQAAGLQASTSGRTGCVLPEMLDDIAMP